MIGSRLRGSGLRLIGSESMVGAIVGFSAGFRDRINRTIGCIVSFQTFTKQL